jgi:hypothetical protein
VYSAGTNGASLFNSAASDYLSFGNIGLDGHSGDFSIEGWIYPTAFVASSNPLYTQGSAGGVSDLLEISLNSSGQPHAFINQGSITLQSTFVCPLNAWTFLQLKRTSGTLAIFTNGVQSSTVSNTATISSPNRGFVGAQSYDTSHADRSFYGFICDVRVSVVTRNVSLPTAPLAVTDSNTKLLLNMADGQAIDSAAQNNLTLIGNTDTSTGQAKFGNTSLFYDGSGDGAYYANGAALGTGDWTIETFLWVNDFNANLGVFQYGGADGALGSMVLTNQKIRVLSSNVAARLDTSGTINAQTWYHVAYVSYGGTLKVYINGTADSTTFDASSTTWTFTDTNIYVGARYYSSAVQLPFDGYLDEFRVSHFARYTSNFTAPTEPFPDKGQ